jgi:hypothetical protein
LKPSLGGLPGSSPVRPFLYGPRPPLARSVHATLEGGDRGLPRPRLHFSVSRPSRERKRGTVWHPIPPHLLGGPDGVRWPAGFTEPSGVATRLVSLVPLASSRLASGDLHWGRDGEETGLRRPCDFSRLPPVVHGLRRPSRFPRYGRLSRAKPERPSYADAFWQFRPVHPAARSRVRRVWVRMRGSTWMCVAFKQTCPRPRPRAQHAFKVSMIHGVLQFALRIAFRCVLHRARFQDIHRQEWGPSFY